MEQTPDEVEQRYMQEMGADLGKVFYRLWNECVWVHWKWNEYEVLFGSKPERIDLLNAAAPALFNLIQDLMWEDILLHLSRLTDRSMIAGRENLTVRQLPSLVVTAIRPEVEQLLSEASQKCEFARDWRNRHIAHRDFRLAADENTSPLAMATRRNVKDALGAIAALLNAVEREYTDTTVAYSLTAPRNGAKALLYVLRDGIDANNAREQRLRSGQVLPEDIAPRPTL